MMLKILLKKIKFDYGLIKDTKGLYNHVIMSYNSAIEKSYAGYTVFLGIAPLLVAHSLI